MAALGKRRDRLFALDEIRLQYAALAFAASYAGNAARRDPTILPQDAEYRLRDLESAAASLEETYVIRLFAEFEACLRSYWSTNRATTPVISVLMDAIASKSQLRIPPQVLVDAHEVRTYRNSLVHDLDESSVPLSSAESCHRLSLYLSRLPWDW